MDKLIINDQEFKGLVASLCRDISNDGWRPDYVVGITRGGLQPAVMISHYFDVRMETLKVSLRDNEYGMGPESNLWMAEDAFGYVTYEGDAFPPPADRVKFNPESRKNILIVDDINDSGATLKWIVNDWKSSCLPSDPSWNEVWGHNVRFATIVNNEASSFPYNIYSALTVNKRERDVWIEFPYESWWK